MIVKSIQKIKLDFVLHISKFIHIPLYIFTDVLRFNLILFRTIICTMKSSHHILSHFQLLFISVLMWNVECFMEIKNMYICILR